VNSSSVQQGLISVASLVGDTYLEFCLFSVEAGKINKNIHVLLVQWEYCTMILQIMIHVSTKNIWSPLMLGTLIRDARLLISCKYLKSCYNMYFYRGLSLRFVTDPRYTAILYPLPLISSFSSITIISMNDEERQLIYHCTFIPLVRFPPRAPLARSTSKCGSN
jgi:hypothetical protein